MWSIDLIKFEINLRPLLALPQFTINTNISAVKLNTWLWGIPLLLFSTLKKHFLLILDFGNIQFLFDILLIAVDIL